MNAIERFLSWFAAKLAVVVAIAAVPALMFTACATDLPREEAPVVVQESSPEDATPSTTPIATSEFMAKLVPGYDYPDAPSGFQIDEIVRDPGPMLQELITSETTTPLNVITVRYIALADILDSVTISETSVITLTMSSYDSRAGALSTYNGWFARFGFPAAAERRSLSFGDAAELFDLEWPPLHAVIARSEKRFALVVGNMSIPEPVRTAAMESLARAAIGAEPLAPTSGAP